MPYIDRHNRNLLELMIDNLAAHLVNIPDDDIEGVLHYTIMELGCRSMKRPTWRYRWINRFMGVLECVKQEFYRRIAAVREDQVKQENGDIPAFLDAFK